MAVVSILSYDSDTLLRRLESCHKPTSWNMGAEVTEIDLERVFVLRMATAILKSEAAFSVSMAPNLAASQHQLIGDILRRFLKQTDIAAVAGCGERSIRTIYA